MHVINGSDVKKRVGCAVIFLWVFIIWVLLAAALQCVRLVA